MRRLTRIGAGIAGIATLLALVTGTALAGGWAEATILTDSGDPPVAGEEREVRFSLLQHGVMAVDHGDASLTATHAETGERFVVDATSLGGGRWSATVTFPTEGTWEIGISHDSLATSEPVELAVGQPDATAWLPAAFAIGVFGAGAVAVVIGMLVTRGRLTVQARPARAG